MTLHRDGGGWADIKCNRCGYYNSWEWEGVEKPTPVPETCPQCEDAPFLDAMRARYRHWKAMRRFRGPDFIATVWAPDTADAIEAHKVLSKMVEREFEVDAHHA